jgi:hypothetical protein
MTKSRAAPFRWCRPAISTGFLACADGFDLKRSGKVIGRVRPWQKSGVGRVWYWYVDLTNGDGYNTLWAEKDIPKHFDTVEAAKESCLAYVKGKI